MTKIKNITAKNFLSIGNQTQAIDFDQECLTLVLGENLDKGEEGGGNRNGVGKTVMVNALSYALYGQALTKIRKENLINNINGKAMLVTVLFEKDGVSYRIERGRKPNILRLYINDVEQATKDVEEDEAQGDSRETQKFITECLGMSHVMFKNLIALNTYSEPFLSMRASDQRDVIEELLGITLLSEKAEKLKIASKTTKDQILGEQLKIEAIESANANIRKSIASLELKSKVWNKKQQDDLVHIAESIVTLENINIENELEEHKKLSQWLEKKTKLTELKKRQASYQTALVQAEKSVKKYINEISSLNDKTCPQCSQSLKAHDHTKLLDEASGSLADSEQYFKSVSENLSKIEGQLPEYENHTPRPKTFYETYADALDHKNQLGNLQRLLETKSLEVDTYQDQINELKNAAIQTVDWNEINELSKLRDHQEFLLKLLTNKESFVRKKIINKNLPYLNSRLSYYLDKLGLPHKVTFMDDLTAEITHYGKDLDFDNLSRGERNRLILSFSFSFRDIWEHMNHKVNLLFVDELLDSGMDTAGVEAGLGVLKKMVREGKKNILLISHKEELIGRVNSVLKVTKSSGFTSYANSTEYVEVGP